MPWLGLQAALRFQFAPIVWTHLLEAGFLGVLLTSLNNRQVLPKDARHPIAIGSQGPGKSKKQVQNSTNGTNKP
jgi:hypothetical protein